MAQHFLLSPSAVSLTMGEVWTLTDDEAHAKLKAIRWPDGIPTCPVCGSKESWQIDKRKWKCRGKRIDQKTGNQRWCYYQYTITTQTHLHSRKRSLKHILAACLSFANAVLGSAALRQRREIRNAYKTPFVFQHRIRAAIETANRREMAQGPFMEGVVEVDGMYVTGKREKRKELILDENDLERFFDRYRETHTALVVVRERSAPGSGIPGRVRTTHVPKEGDAIPFIARIVKPGTIVHADCTTQFDRLNAFFKMERVNHSVSYKQGVACTNQAESFFSRVKAAKRGVYRSWRKSYVGWYGAELAWREENSRLPNGDQVEAVLKLLLQIGRSPVAGYWQRHLNKLPA